MDGILLDHSHLTPPAQSIAVMPAAERIAHVRPDRGRWIGYGQVSRTTAVPTSCRLAGRALAPMTGRAGTYTPSEDRSWPASLSQEASYNSRQGLSCLLIDLRDSAAVIVRERARAQKIV